MDWEQLKDWKVIGAIITYIAGAITWILKTKSDRVEIIKAQAETKKINQEIEAAEKREIENLKLELKKIRLELNKTSRMITKIIKIL